MTLFHGNALRFLFLDFLVRISIISTQKEVQEPCSTALAYFAMEVIQDQLVLAQQQGVGIILSAGFGSAAPAQ
jgi:hypothetical protein